MNLNLIASAVLVISVSGLIVINKGDNESHPYAPQIQNGVTSSIKTSGNVNEGFLAAAYRETRGCCCKRAGRPT
jgi:hypothetical protein